MLKRALAVSDDQQPTSSADLLPPTEFPGARPDSVDALPKPDLTLVRATSAPAQPPAPRQQAKPQDALALIAALSEEEKIALFS